MALSSDSDPSDAFRTKKISTSFKGFVLVQRAYEPVKKLRSIVNLVIEIGSHSPSTRRCVRLLSVVQLEAAFEFSKCFVDGQHLGFLQYERWRPGRCADSRAETLPGHADLSEGARDPTCYFGPGPSSLQRDRSWHRRAQPRLS